MGVPYVINAIQNSDLRFFSIVFFAYSQCENRFRSYSQYVKHHRVEHKGVPVPCDVTQVCEICGVTVKVYIILFIPSSLFLLELIFVYI